MTAFSHQRGVLPSFSQLSAPNSHPRSRAFTLIELLVVIGIIAVLAAIAFPVTQRIAAAAKATACVSNLRQIGAALGVYLSENSMTMPDLKAGRKMLSDDGPVIDDTLDRYVKNKAVFACPADPHYARESGTSYYWNTAINGQHTGALNFFKLSDEHSHIPILADKEGFHPYLDTKVNILYADGHASKDISFVTGQ